MHLIVTTTTPQTIGWIVTDQPIPPSPSALLASLRERGVWSDTSTTGEAGLLWSTLRLVSAPFEVDLSFTVGDALPPSVRDWLPWAGRDLDDAGLACLHRPRATYCIRSRPAGGGVPLTGPTERQPTADERAAKDNPRRAACFTSAVSAETALAVSGVLIDACAQRFWHGSRLSPFLGGAFDVRDYVSVHAQAGPHGLELHTHGLRRFGRVDVEMGHVPHDALPFGTRVLNEISQHQALGNVVRNGETLVVDGEYAFSLSATSKSGSHVGNEVLALVDPSDAPHRDARAPRQTLARFCEDVADEMLTQPDLQGALRWLSHAVLLAPMISRLLRKRAGVLAHLGREADANADMENARALEASAALPR